MTLEANTQDAHARIDLDCRDGGLDNAEVAAKVTIGPVDSPVDDAADPFAGAQRLTENNLEGALASARKAFLAANDNAAAAAARAFVVWYWCRSAVATGSMKAAYNAKVKATNDEIAKHNDKITTEVAAVKKRSEEHNKQLTEEISKVNDPDHKAALETELAGLKDKLDDEIKALRRGRQVKIGERNDAASFTEEVKFTLELVNASQAGQVNRYANAVGWIHAELYSNGSLIGQQRPDAAEIAQRIKEAGGVDRVAQVYRDARRDTDEAEDRRLIATGVAEKVKQTLTSMAPAATANFDVGGPDGEMVALLARKVGGVVELLDSLPLTKEALGQLAATHFDPARIAGDGPAEFISELLQAAGDIASPVLVYRGGLRLVASFIAMEDGAPVIHAEPKGKGAASMPGDVEVLLRSPEVKALAERLGSAHQRKLVRLTVAAEPGEIGGKCPVPSPFAWQTENETLLDQQRASAVALHKWTDLQHVSAMPHDVVGFDPNITVTLSRADIDVLSTGQLKAWEEDKAATKASQVMTLAFSGSSLTLTGSKGSDQVTVSVVGKQPTRVCQVTVHPRTLSHAFKVARSMRPGAITLAPDDRGAIKVSWETEFGSYASFLPLCRPGHKFETRLIAPMR